MKIPEGYESMTDEQLREELRKNYDDDAVEYILDVLRGNSDHTDNGPIY